MRSNVLVYYNTSCNFVLLEDQGLPEEDFVKIEKNKKILIEVDIFVAMHFTV